ncbi:PREDICTED: uncharacterized protein LOC103339206 [Prunus mume]|uniref:Uncharacterized protein LOC103339206 n=1 Tax=Prunus mume TaxID=102107 RepID=A0ABM0PK02_PRUMU|nr:PREDICTED: uncharacterized protein LOC103339206 [Prunus mume]
METGSTSPSIYCDFVPVASKRRRRELEHPRLGAWASLLEGRDALIKDSRCQIFNGANTNIWKDSWLHPPHEGIINVSQLISPSAPQQVCEIMDKVNHSWRVDLIDSYVSRETIDIIRCCPIGNSDGCDRRVWPWTSNGDYTVKSGYRRIHAQKRIREGEGGSTSHVVQKEVWQSIWKIVTLPKIRVFLWRLLNDAISTRWNLFKRKIVNSPLCPICGQLEETVEHLLFLCPWTQAVWFGAPLSYRVNLQGFSTFDKWLLEVLSLKDMGKKEIMNLFSMISFTCWEIWKSRCNFIFKGYLIDPIVTIDRTMRAFREFMGVKTRPEVSIWVAPPDPLRQTSRWMPPEVNFLKINFDGAWQLNFFKAGLGVIVGNEEGLFCWGLATSFRCSAALVAEAAAGLCAVKLSSFFSDVRWNWVPRHLNCAAHKAAAIGARAVQLDCWAVRPPPSLVGVLVSDGLPCPPVEVSAQ